MTNSSQAPQQREIGFYKLKDVKETKDNVVETKYFDIIQAKVANIKYNGTQFSYPCCAVNKECKKKVEKLNEGKKITSQN